MVWALIMNRHPGQLHSSIFASTSPHWNVSALQPPLCSLNLLLFFFLSHKILESIYAWNRYENLVGVRLSFSSGVAPPYPHGLWYNHLLTVVLKANTLNFMGKCRIQPMPCFCFCREHTELVKMNEFNILCPVFQEGALCHPELDLQLWPDLWPHRVADWLGQRGTTQMKIGKSVLLGTWMFTSQSWQFFY